MLSFIPIIGKYLKLSLNLPHVDERFAARTRQLLRYIARSANQLEEIEDESEDQEDRWKSNDLAVDDD